MPHSKKLNNSYQRFEFLGDRVLNLIVSHYLCIKFPDYSEGELTNKLRFTSNDNLEDIIESLPDTFRKEFFKFKRDFKPESQELKADDVEAYIGSYYLKHGLVATISYFEKIFAEKIDAFNPNTDYISRLKIYSEQNQKPQPDYKLNYTEKGQNNQQFFHFQVFISDELLGSGVGNSHPKAKQMAARETLKNLGLEN